MKSPIKEQPLNLPGESLEQEVQRILSEKLLMYLMGIVFLLVVTMFEWISYLSKSPPSPYPLTFFTFFTVLFLSWKISRAFREAKQYKQGAKGEKDVAYILDQFREEGGKILHDIPGQGFNIDHVLIHRTGVYVIETKTLSKPDQGRETVYFDGSTIFRENQPLLRNPAEQVSANTSWLKGLIHKSTGHDYWMRPVVLFPGRFVKQIGAAKRQCIWVLNPNAFIKFVNNEPTRLSSEEIQMINFHLERYIRATKSNG